MKTHLKIVLITSMLANVNSTPELQDSTVREHAATVSWQSLISLYCKSLWNRLLTFTKRYRLLSVKECFISICSSLNFVIIIFLHLLNSDLLFFLKVLYFGASHNKNILLFLPSEQSRLRSSQSNFFIIMSRSTAASCLQSQYRLPFALTCIKPC